MCRHDMRSLFQKELNNFKSLLTFSVCFVFLFSFTTSVKESYSHPYDEVTEEPCSDPRTSYRCIRHRYKEYDDFFFWWADFLFLPVVRQSVLFDRYSFRITYKTAYRQAVKTDYRRRYQCCPGYYESRDKCVRK